MKKIVALVLVLVLALSLATVAFAKPDDPEQYYAAKTDAAIEKGTKIDMNKVTFNKAVAPATEDGKTTAGNIAYYAITEETFKGNYVVVDKLADADLVIATDEAMKNVYLYLDKVTAVSYVNGAAFDNFGKKCGQCEDTYDKTATYYTYEVGGKTMIAAADAKGEFAVMVGGKLVVLGAEKKLKLVKHQPVAIVDKETGKTTGYKCNVCGVDAVDAGNVASIPASAQQVPGTSFYFAAAAVPAATTTTGVSSAKTFDAGVALYAGMALMSVAGSAVVIGKKKEF